MMKYQNLIGQMTLEEKASLMSGANFWNTKSIERLQIPSMMLTDGPHGLRKQGGAADHLGLNKSLPATCFPPAATLANSWDVSLAETVGACIGREAAAQDVSVVLGPGLNIKRNPLCGRNFEYFSEDPYLSGKMAAALVRGIQSEGVSACVKHFAVNSQEHRRMVIDEVLDERALREIYLEGFRYAICEGGAKSVMTSYNRVNGTYANENSHLLQDILCGEWGFEGLIVTDWGGNNDRVAGLIAGNQLEMPSTNRQTDREIVEAVRAGVLDEAILDERVNSLLELLFETQAALGQGKRYTYEEHHETARDAARRSIVLLKNEKSLLPLDPKSTIAVIGDFAQTPRYQGAGSSLINPTKLDNALDALNSADLNIIGYAPGFRRLGGKSAALRRQAVNLAQKADIALLFLGLDEGGEAEGLDRDNMRLPEKQLELLASVRKVCENVVVVLSCGASVESRWSSQADAIVHAYLGGQAGGSAVADVLTGRYNPSGKLSETYPLRYEDCPSAPWFPGMEKTAEHRESIFVGYRYFDTVEKAVAWPFGHGLTYTAFEYGDLSVTTGEVSFTIRNTGPVFGEEITQVYVSKPDSAVFRAEKELKGFAKTALEPGEEKRVSIRLDDHAFACFDTGQSAWVTEVGQYRISVGASSRDIRLTGTAEPDRRTSETACNAEKLPNYFAANVHSISDAEFEELLGRPIPESRIDKSLPLGYNDTIAQGRQKKCFGRFLCGATLLARRALFLLNKPVAANNVMFIANLPFRQLFRMSGGRIDKAMVDGILVMVNEGFWKGLGQVQRANKAKKQREKSEREH